MENLAVLIRPEEANTTKGKNVVIGDPGSENYAGLTLYCKVVMEKLPDGEETTTITIMGSTMGCHERKAEGVTSAPNDRKRKSTAMNQEKVVRLPPDRLDRHGEPP
jgi:hypothetical protein